MSKPKKLSGTPVSLIMEDSIHISSSGSLAGSIGELIIPISDESVLKDSLSHSLKKNSSAQSTEIVKSDLKKSTHAPSIRKSNSFVSGEFKKSRSITRSNSTKDRGTSGKSLNGSSIRDGFRSRSNSAAHSNANLRANSTESLSRKSTIKKDRGEKSRVGSNDFHDTQSDMVSSDSESFASTLSDSVITDSALSLYNSLFTYSGEGQVVKMIKRKKQKGKLLPKLTNSEIELLGEKTGEFNGLNDKYRRFLSGDAKLKTIYQPPPWELTVGLPPVSAKRGKVDLGMPWVARAELKKKSQVLEELRIFQEENTLLAKLHEKGFSEINRKVSKITSENEKLDHQLLQLIKERKALKKGLVDDWEAFVKKLDWQVSKVQKTFKEKENQYEEACRELIGLQNFKNLTLQGSDAVENKKHEGEVQKQEILLQLERELEQINARIKAEDLETSNKLFHQIGDIIDSANLVMKNLVNKKTLAVYRRNHNLKHEIQVHTQVHETNKVALKKLGDHNAKLKLDLENSLKKSKPICTPDMEFTFSFQQKS